MSGQASKPRISIEVDVDLRRRLRMAAARRDVTIKRYVLAAVERALEAEETADWSQLSEFAFARDWDSEADAVYDRL